MRLFINSSQVASADNCRRQHWFQYVRKVKVLAPAANLTFGKCVDVSVREYLWALALNQPRPDPVARFSELWAQERQCSAMTYAATQTPEDFEEIGVGLMRILPGAWEASGLQIALDANGEPLINRHLEIELGRRGHIEVVWIGTIDLIVYTPHIELAVLDLKSAATAHTLLYALRADQLTSYQLLTDVHGPRLGLPPLVKLGFWDLLKRKNPRIEAPLFAPRRSTEELAEFRDKVFWLAEDMVRERFPRASRMQFNTPCELCDFARFCVENDEEGLLFEGAAAKRPVMAARLPQRAVQ